MLSSKFLVPTCLGFGLFALSGACGGSNLGNQVKPDAPTAQGAVEGESELACKQGSYAEPLIVDLSANTRVDLEARMKESVVMVNYDCDKMKILKDCSLNGDYGFAGVSRKEQVISLNNQDELKANLPFSSGSAGGSLETGSQLNLALVMVGKRTTAASVSKPVISGSQCGEATHYVRSAIVGAFAMKTGQKGKVAATVELFGMGTSGQSSADEKRTSKDGDLNSCKSSKPDAETPPEQCRSAIRLELVPIAASGPVAPKKGEKKKDEGKQAKPMENPCANEGFVLVNGKCTNSADAKGPKLCAPTNTAECKTECGKGSMESCHNYAELVFGNLCKDPSKKAECDGTTTAQNEAREREAMSFWKKACDGGVHQACDQFGNYALASVGGMKANPPAGIKALQKGCDLGNAAACWLIGDIYIKGTNGATEDELKGLNLKQRACDLGEADSCMELGAFYFQGKHLAKNPKRGFQFLKQFCDQGNLQTCEELGEHLLGTFDRSDDDVRKSGVKVVTEVENADKIGRELLEKACAGGDVYGSCSRLGAIYYQEKNWAEARKFLPKACKGDGDSCLKMAELELEGKGGPKDKASAMEFWAVSVDDEKMYAAAQAFEKGVGIPKDAARAIKLYGDVCDNDVKKGCRALKRADKAEYEKHMAFNCARETEWTCKELKRLNKDSYLAALNKLCAEDSEDGCKWLKKEDSDKAKNILEANCKKQEADKTDDDKYACKYKKALFGG